MIAGEGKDIMQPITIENDALRVQVYPDFGGKVASVVDKDDGYDLMFSYAHTPPTKPLYDIGYGDGWYAGWDECFPGIAPGEYPQYPYAGVKVADHGELWGIPTESRHSANGIVTRWRGIRFGYELTRNLMLVGNALEAEYELKNFAPSDFHFVWALHSLMRLDQSVEFEYGGDKAWRWSHVADGTLKNTPFTWPTCTSGENLAKPNELPANKGWKVFSATTIDRPFAIFYPQRKRKLSISYESDSQVAAYWGIWINSGGWAGHRHFAIEPTTGLHDSLSESIEDGSAAKVGPLGTVNWKVRWTVE